MNMTKSVKTGMLKKNSIWILIILLVVSLGVMVTLITEQLEDTLGLHWDLTSNQVYSIGDATRSSLAALDKRINIYTVYPQGEEDRTIGELLKHYKMASGYIEVKNIDPISTPLFLNQFESEDEEIENNDIIVTLADDETNFRVIKAENLYEWNLDKDKLYATGLAAEQRITSAIVSLMGGKQHVAYFMEGHKEMDINALYYLKGTLDNDEYDVDSYHLVYNDKHLSEGDCVIFVAPLSDLTDEEYGILSEFLSNGGRAVFMINPMAPELPNFEKVLSGFGLTLGRDMIVEGDSSHYYNNPVILRPDILDASAISMIKEAGSSVVMSRCRSVGISEVEDVKSYPLLTTTSQSYGKVNPLTETLDREEGDTDGPFVLAAAAENTRTGARVVLYGSTDFISSLDNAKFAGNLTAFMGAVSWSSGKGASVVIKPKTLTNPKLEVSSQTQSMLLITLVAVVLPAAVIISGIIVWRRRVRR
jgi:ABC-2 type transport system permease protein